MNERTLQDCVLALARVYGWKTLHIRPARTVKGYRTPLQGDGVGWPDFVAVRGGEIIAAELKSDRGSLTQAQREWLNAIEGAGVRCFIWRPAHWPEVIEKVLRQPERAHRDAEGRSERLTYARAGNVLTALPAAHGLLADAELSGEARLRPLRSLAEAPDLGGDASHPLSVTGRMGVDNDRTFCDTARREGDRGRLEPPSGHINHLGWR